MLKGTPAFPVRCKVRLSPITRKPTRVKIFMPKRISLVSTSVSTAAMLPVVLGMYVGQHMRDNIAPETFEKLVLIAVIAAGAELLRHGFFS
jgi:uncharacterized membrane protein YfcA